MNDDPLLAIGEDLKRGVPLSIKEIVVFDEEEITEEILQNRVKDITRRIDELRKHYQKSQPVGRTATNHPGKRESTRIPPLPRPRCTIMLMHCRRLHGLSTRRQILTFLLLNVAR